MTTFRLKRGQKKLKISYEEMTMSEHEREAIINELLRKFPDKYDKEALEKMPDDALEALKGLLVEEAEEEDPADVLAGIRSDTAFTTQLPQTTANGLEITDVLGMQSAAPGQGPGGSTDYTVGMFQTEFAQMSDSERERLAQALYLEGYYGTIRDISEIMDPTRFSNAMLASLRHGVTAFSGVAKTAEGMEAVPTLEGRFKDFSEEEFEQAKNALLKKFSPATKSVAELKEIIDEVATSQARRGLTTEETQIVLVAVQAAAKMSAASPLNQGFNYQRAAGEAVTEAIGPVEAGTVELEDYWDNYASQALGLG
jgi:hypothetical protein